ncbi:MAG TPA: tripartite tricarboxylate transporter substrate binding protein [Burkholderiales bacterium]|nr:tripartite tricarboxylate transporter substrate binding protein [Burkholderiales bacterium]
MKTYARLIALAAACLAAAAATAQTYPTKSVRIVVGLAPGGTTDVVSRILAQRLGETWGQTVVVDNRPGASGMIGGDIVAKAPPDGYTLLVTPQTSVAVAPALYGKAPYDAARDFVTISLVGSTPLLMVVHPSFPPKTFREFVAVARQRGNTLTFGSGGIGSSPHMAGELISARLGVRMNHVPYKGENPALADTLGGQIPIMFGNLPVAVPHVNTGKLRALANTFSRRSPLAPSVPTIAESGFPDFSIATWYGMLAPAGTPPELVARIQRDAARVVNQADTRERLVGMGVDIIASTPEEFSKFLREEIARYTKVVKDAGLKAE